MPGTGGPSTRRSLFPSENAALKTLYLTTRSLDPKGTGQQRWITRWKPVLNVLAIRPSPTACPPLTSRSTTAGYTVARTVSKHAA